ncbi:MAG TPA: hypothetical protein VMS17_29825 [Gemmataceae bacterium]|nr:hypothetical protein [Gemmataceae bacterium]
MLFAESQPNALVLFPLIFGLTVAFLIGDIVGLLPFFIARWKRRPGMAALALVSCGVSAVVLLPLCLVVAVGFTVTALVMGRRDVSRDLARQADAVYRNERAQGGTAGAVNLSSARYLEH